MDDTHAKVINEFRKRIEYCKNYLQTNPNNQFTQEKLTSMQILIPKLFFMEDCKEYICKYCGEGILYPNECGCDGFKDEYY
ncbi:hypothetical protein [Neobacillus drentensis]|uniref:hypothetical protein n=1 Tax=Neobacillus drentensis TaxID=220684 RepID=UPI003001F20B